MMKKIWIIITALLPLIDTTTVQAQAQQNLPHCLDNKTHQAECILIVFYDPNYQTQVFTAIAKQQGEIIYDYQNFSILAVKVTNPIQAQEALSQVEGIYQVQFNQIMHLNH